MMRRTDLIRTVGAGVLLVAGVACSGTSSSPKTGKVNEDPVCIGLIERYVVQTRGWSRASYEVREESSDLGGRGFEVWHESDSTLKPPGGDGMSFHVEVDLDCRKVVKELAYQ